jgi:hypothetical protein
MDTSNQLGQQLVELLRSNSVDFGRDFVADIDEVRAYAAARMVHLSTVVAQPGFREALAAERDNVVLKAAGRAIDRGDSFDARMLAITEGALAIGSRALAIAVPG